MFNKLFRQQISYQLSGNLIQKQSAGAYSALLLADLLCNLMDYHILHFCTFHAVWLGNSKKETFQQNHCLVPEINLRHELRRALIPVWSNQNIHLILWDSSWNKQTPLKACSEGSVGCPEFKMDQFSCLIIYVIDIVGAGEVRLLMNDSLCFCGSEVNKLLSSDILWLEVSPWPNIEICHFYF